MVGTFLHIEAISMRFVSSRTDFHHIFQSMNESYDAVGWWDTPLPPLCVCALSGSSIFQNFLYVCKLFWLLFWLIFVWKFLYSYIRKYFVRSWFLFSNHDEYNNETLKTKLVKSCSFSSGHLFELITSYFMEYENVCAYFFACMWAFVHTYLFLIILLLLFYGLANTEMLAFVTHLINKVINCQCFNQIKINYIFFSPHPNKVWQ